MEYVLRPYQQEAHNCIINWVKKSIDPCVIDAATGSGKSLIIAALAKTIFDMTGKHVLCLAPSAELVIQNKEKYLLTGNAASVFSASAGGKCLRHPVVFGTPGTVKNQISKFGNKFAMIIVDECHSITPTVKTIIDEIRKVNSKVRIVGMSATPYRMGTGYIYALNPDGSPVPLHQTKNPYFTSCVYKIHAGELIRQGYLTPPQIGSLGAQEYDTSHMQLNNTGKFAADDIDKAFLGQGRKTSKIIADIIEQSRDRNGVMIFASTIQHAGECMASLPSELSAVVTSKTSKADRKKIIKGFKNQRIKYIVNVSVLTTGFDAPHVDVIAMLRTTESVGLLQQIVGRGLRIYDGKEDCLVLDYADNIDRHCPDGDIFKPEIQVTVNDKERVAIDVACPDCGVVNDFSARPNKDGFEYSQDGYFLDLDGNRIQGDYGDIPSHFGRRCQALYLSTVNRGTYEQCGYRWNFKECPVCQTENDIAARYCFSCKGEIVNPNEKLRLDFKAMKRDATQVQTDEILNVKIVETISRTGNPTYRADWVTPYRSLSTWVQKEPKNIKGQRQLSELKKAFEGGKKPSTITYYRMASGFYRLLGFNNKKDEVNEV